MSECIQPSWVSLQWPSNGFTALPMSNSPRNFSSSPFFDDSKCFRHHATDEPYSWSSFPTLNHMDDSHERSGSQTSDPRFGPTNRATHDSEVAGRYTSVAMTTLHDSRLLGTGVDEDNPHTRKRKSISVLSRQCRPARTRSSHQERFTVAPKGRRKSVQTMGTEGEKGQLGMKRRTNAADSPRQTQSTAIPAPTKKAPSDSDPPKVRHNHNITEKRYRSRLNDQFDTLLSALPASSVAAIEGSSGEKEAVGRKISKAEVLILAKEHIQALETSREDLEEQNRRLTADMEQLEIAWGRLIGRMMP
ncbi:hypothetical protein BKA65DRAFT_278983 [Rhexocercosporidium sp. MPI-PUGE-AT-0058]|nr:hypothetical protein BKA65DRAFT_278983 [Rhexocercosporidium sp. MPI-PUGE-AT-0058]